MLWEVEITPKGADAERQRVADEFRLLTHREPPQQFLGATRGYLFEGELGEAQIERLQKVCARFHQHIAPDDAAVGNAVLHINGHVRRFDEHEAITPALIFNRESARSQRFIARAHARTRQHVQSLVLHPPFRQRDSQGGGMRAAG